MPRCISSRSLAARTSKYRVRHVPPHSIICIAAALSLYNTISRTLYPKSARSSLRPSVMLHERAEAFSSASAVESAETVQGRFRPLLCKPSWHLIVVFRSCRWWHNLTWHKARQHHHKLPSIIHRATFCSHSLEISLSLL